LLDHIIVAGLNKYISLAEQGYLPAYNEEVTWTA